MGDAGVAEFRLKLIEEQQRDHELRLRKLEVVAIKIGVWAFVGSVVGGAIVAALAGRIFNG